jgi:hypothetical protein
LHSSTLGGCETAATGSIVVSIQRGIFNQIPHISTKQNVNNFRIDRNKSAGTLQISATESVSPNQTSHTNGHTKSTSVINFTLELKFAYIFGEKISDDFVCVKLLREANSIRNIRIRNFDIGAETQRTPIPALPMLSEKRWN